MFPIKCAPISPQGYILLDVSKIFIPFSLFPSPTILSKNSGSILFIIIKVLLYSENPLINIFALKTAMSLISFSLYLDTSMLYFSIKSLIASLAEAYFC